MGKILDSPRRQLICCCRAYDTEALQLFGPTATLNFGPPPGTPAASPQQAEGFPAAAPDGAQQLAMLSGVPVPYQQQAPELSPPIMPAPVSSDPQQREPSLRLKTGWHEFDELAAHLQRAWLPQGGARQNHVPTPDACT